MLNFSYRHTEPHNQTIPRLSVISQATLLPEGSKDTRTKDHAWRMLPIILFPFRLAAALAMD